MNKSWFNYYKGHDRVHISNILLHWFYLLQIIKYGKQNILEIGCGPADHSISILKIKPNLAISLLDYDKKIIDNLKNKFKNKILNYYVCDITNKSSVKKLKFKKDQYDLIYSQGLLEHFKKKEFINIIRNFIPYTNIFIFSIPSENYPNLDFGNEILRNREELTKIIKQVGGIKYKIFNYFPDIGLRTKLIKIKKDKLSLIEAVKMLLFGTLHYLIEVEKN